VLALEGLARKAVVLDVLALVYGAERLEVLALVYGASARLQATGLEVLAEAKAMARGYTTPPAKTKWDCVPFVALSQNGRSTELMNLWFMRESGIRSPVFRVAEPSLLRCNTLSRL
jgi:hypothetical protein